MGGTDTHHDNGGQQRQHVYGDEDLGGGNVRADLPGEHHAAQRAESVREGR
ncbi:MAG: hypothetical protein IPF53_20995 [Blastocatellia bacterium]|nr:hypothetical protein [Blastocatellia bacterium]